MRSIRSITRQAPGGRQYPYRAPSRVSIPIPFLGGWNDDQNHAALSDDDLRIAKNIMRYRSALIGSRFGSDRDPFASVLNSGASITGIFELLITKDSVIRPIFISGNKLYTEDAAGVATDSTGAVTITAGQDNVFTGAVIKNQYVLTNGMDVPIVIGSAGNASALSGWFANSRKAEFVHQQWGYLFFGGFSGTRNTGGGEGANQDPMAVYHSDLFDPNTWTEGNIIDKVGGISVYGDEYVTALFRHRDFMMVGTNRRIYPVTYTGDLAARFVIQRPLNVGVAHQRAVVSINSQHTLFMDPDGDIHSIVEVANTFGDVGIQSLSRKIRNYTTGFNRTKIKRACGAYWKDRGWAIWAVPAASTASGNTEMIVLDLNDFPLDEPDHRLARWYQWTNLPANAIGLLHRNGYSASAGSSPSATGREQLYFGTTTGWAKRPNTEISYDESDSGSSVEIQTDLATKYFDFGAPGKRKSIAEVITHIQPAKGFVGPSMSIYYDFGARISNSRLIDMPRAQGDRLAPAVSGPSFILNNSRLAGDGDGTGQTVDYFTEEGTHASIRIQKAVSGTESWKIQDLTAVVEMSGLPSEGPTEEI